jgi:tetratricopeptide (TPR) repeat protein
MLCVAVGFAGEGKDKPEKKRAPKPKPQPKISEAKYQVDLANVHMRYQKFDVALQALDLAAQKAETDQEKAHVAATKANCLARSGKKDEAVAAAEEALKLSSDPGTVMAVSGILIGAGKAATVIDPLREAVDKNPKDKRALYALINAYVAAKQKEDAQALLKKAVDDAANDNEKIRTLQMAAGMNLRLGDLDAALANCNDIKQLPDLQGSHKRADGMIKQIEHKKNPPKREPRKPAEKKQPKKAKKAEE